MRKQTAGYFLFIAVLVVIISTASYAWARFKATLVKDYIQEEGLSLITDEELEAIKSQSYNEGYEAAKEELSFEIENAYDDGYESALEEYNVAGAGVTYATVYYVDGGRSYHMNPSCLSIRQTNKTVHETTLDKLGTSLDPCDICVAHSND